MSELPNGWVKIALGEAIKIQKGKKPIGLGQKGDDRSVPYINIWAFETKQVAEYAPQQDKPRCEPADTLLVWDGARAGLAGRGIGGFIGSTLARLTSDLTNPAFLYYFVHSNYGYLNTHTKGVGIPHIDPVALAEIPFRLPPSGEQTRIVAKLEELLSDLDAGVAELKAAQKKLVQYRQSLLKAAVEGALTAEWRKQNPPGETGAQLLARILTERRARWEAKQLAKFEEQGKPAPKDWQSKYPEPVAPDTTALPELPQGWVWASLGQLLQELTSGSRDWSPYYGRGNCTFVMAQNVRPWRPDFSFRQPVDPPEGDRDRDRSEIKKDDLLITIVGANTGQCCRIPEQFENYFVCQSVALLRPVLPVISEFINAVLNSPAHGQRQFREMNYGAGRPHLSFDQITSVVIPLPPIHEQPVIIESLETALAAVTEQDRAILLSLKQSAAQRKNILKAAFCGQLVKQDENDEPASRLLERIRTERAAQAVVKKARGRKTREPA